MIEYTYPAAPSIKSESTDPDPEIISTPTKIIYHPFPSPSRLAQPGVEEELRILGFGYRAKYIARTAQMLCEENSEKFKLEQEEKEKQRLEKKGKGKGKRNEIEMLSSTSTTPTSTESNQEIETEIEYSNNGRTKRARKSVNNNLTTISSSLSSVKKKGQGKVETSTKTSSLNVLPKSKAKTDVIDYGKDIDSKVYKFLFSLRSLSYSEAKEKLIVYQGVGPKVADCILLMSLDQPSSIPVDRHGELRRILKSCIMLSRKDKRLTLFLPLFVDLIFPQFLLSLRLRLQMVWNQDDSIRRGGGCLSRDLGFRMGRMGSFGSLCCRFESFSRLST